MPIGDTMTSTIPPVGASGTGYATLIDAFLTEVKALLEAKIPMGSILIEALDMQNNEIQEVKSLGLYEQLVLPTDIGTIQNFGGDLYWVNAAGAVQITNADALNSAAVGGITGDYGGSNPAQWRFDDADQTFYGYDDFAGGKWAHVQARNYRLTGTYAGTERLTLDWVPGTSYTVTFPTAPPAASSLVQMNTAGALTADATLPVNTAASTGTIIHTDRTITQCAGPQGTTSFGMTAEIGLFTLYGIHAGARLKTVKLIHNKTTTGTTSFTVYRVNGGSVAKSPTVTDNVAGLHETIITLTGSGYTLVDEDFMLIQVNAPAGIVADSVYSVTSIYDQPTAV